MTTLFAVGFWGWTQHDGWLKFLLAIGLPVLFALIWGVFAVPNDPSRSGKTVVKTSGWIRLILELAIFGFGVWAFYLSGFQVVSWFFIGVIVIHYLLSYDRIKWLLRN
jgi:hypothetical protein